MKKLLMLVCLLGFGMMVGCQDDTKPKAKDTGATKTTATSTTTTESSKTTGDTKKP